MDESQQLLAAGTVEGSEWGGSVGTSLYSLALSIIVGKMGILTLTC